MKQSTIGGDVYDEMFSRALLQNLGIENDYKTGLSVAALSQGHRGFVMVAPKNNGSFAKPYYFPIHRIYNVEFIKNKIADAVRRESASSFSVAICSDDINDFRYTASFVLKLKDELAINGITLSDFFVTDGYDFEKII